MEKRFFKLGAIAIFVALLALVMAAPQANAAAFWQAKFVHFSATAGATLATGDVVAIDPTTMRAVKADADATSLRPAVGVIGKGGAAGTTVEIVVSGIISGMTNASAGSKLWLSTTAGGFTTTAPATNAQAIGFVLPPESAADVASSQSGRYIVHVNPHPASPGAW